jgi:uncharacterized protein YukE
MQHSHTLGGTSHGDVAGMMSELKGHREDGKRLGREQKLATLESLHLGEEFRAFQAQHQHCKQHVQGITTQLKSCREHTHRANPP